MTVRITRAEDIQDLTRLADGLLSSALEALDAVGGTVWTLDGIRFRQLCAKGSAGKVAPIDPGEILHRHEELSRGTPFFEKRAGKINLSSFFFPILYHDLLVGLLHLGVKPGGKGISDAALEKARALVAEHAPFIHGAMSLEKIRRNPLKDIDSEAYNESFILDFLTRDISVSRRHRRRLGLLNLEFLGSEPFQRKQSYRLVQGILKDIAETLRGVTRDPDVVAHVGNFRFLIALPDTDRLGCRITIERIRSAFEQMRYLKDRFERYGLRPHFGFSSFPEDGDDPESLLMAALEKTRESRKDPFDPALWKDKGFWEVVEELLGCRTGTPSAGVPDSASGQFPSGFFYLLQEALANQVVLHPDRRGLLYIGTNNLYVTEALVQKNPLIGKAATRISVLGDLSGMTALKELNITAVPVPKERSDSFQFILHVSDFAVYGILAVQKRTDLWSCYHSSHLSLVETLIFKLREEYNLQEQI